MGIDFFDDYKDTNDLVIFSKSKTMEKINRLSVQ